MIYEVGRSVDVLDTLTDVIEDACASNGNAGGGVFRPLTNIEALALQQRCTLEKDGYDILRVMLPEGLLPDSPPVRNQKYKFTPMVQTIPGVEDGIMLAGVVADICSHL